jgi:hypothetical protein
MLLHGTCHCGKITFQAEADPNTVILCHCTDCQVLTGSPYRASLQAHNNTLQLLTGHPKIYVKIAEDGSPRNQFFCPDCGTPLYVTGAGKTDPVNLRIGCLAERKQFRPNKQIWCRSALSWSNNLENFPQLEKD